MPEPEWFWEVPADDSVEFWGVLLSEGVCESEFAGFVSVLMGWEEEVVESVSSEEEVAVSVFLEAFAVLEFVFSLEEALTDTVILSEITVPSLFSK